MCPGVCSGRDGIADMCRNFSKRWRWCYKIGQEQWPQGKGCERAPAVMLIMMVEKMSSVHVVGGKLHFHVLLSELNSLRVLQNMQEWFTWEKPHIIGSGERLVIGLLSWLQGKQKVYQPPKMCVPCKSKIQPDILRLPTIEQLITKLWSLEAVLCCTRLSKSTKCKHVYF